MIITNQRPEVKRLWKTAKKHYNLKSRQLFRIALKDEFLPLTAPFRTEADFLLNEAAANNLTTDEIKNSMSRGIERCKIVLSVSHLFCGRSSPDFRKMNCKNPPTLLRETLLGSELSRSTQFSTKYLL